MSGEVANARSRTVGRSQNRTASEYDNLPYPSLPVSSCHPSSLAASLSLFNVSPPRIVDGNVLELGCASGGNLIPLAAQFPNASFVGIDISEVHVTAARARIAQLGLKNIAIHQGDLTIVDLKKSVFDFILCHGVFSWVPRQTQDAVFSLCNKHLSPEGAAVISFNVLPGWHLRRVIRDICLLHAGTEGKPAERARRARQAIVDIASVARGSDLYSTLLRKEAQQLVQRPLGYIMGEFLAETNLPCHFTEFYVRAKQSGLGYVCDADISAALPDNLAPAMAETIHKLARGNVGAMQQQIDLFTGRPFRSAILVRDGRQPQAVQPIDPTKLRALHFAGELSPDRRPEAKADPAFVDAGGRKVTPGDARSHAILSRLAAAFPSTVNMSELMHGEQPSVEGEQAAFKTLLNLIFKGQAAAFATPLRVGRGEQANLIAWSISRLDAAAAQPWITSQHHRAIRNFAVLSLLLPHMDGTRTREDLQAVLETAILNGSLKVPPRKNGTPERPVSASRELNVAIGYAARNGLLVA